MGKVDAGVQKKKISFKLQKLEKHYKKHFLHTFHSQFLLGLIKNSLKLDAY
jgi:hypothetical protein